MPRYREQPPRAELREFVGAVWSLDSAGRTTEAVLPDGCIDIVWRDGFRLVCAGPDTGPVTVERPAAATVIGVRFRPGAAPAMLGAPADALRDLRTPLADLWGPAVDRLEGASLPRQRRERATRSCKRTWSAACRRSSVPIGW
jgi:hypothetical protein